MSEHFREASIEDISINPEKALNKIIEEMPVLNK